MNTSLPFNPLKHPIIFERPLWMTEIRSWSQHIPFAFLLVDLLKPRTFVELGTHTGVSYCAFCQAVRALSTGTRCHAVDTWQGDSQAGYYGEGILATLKAHHDPLYGAFSTLHQCTFDEARPRFEDGSIDLLHIDGLHTYEAVKHDFETWLPKMSARGVVLFHDTHVYREDFGVHQLWAELAQKYPGRAFSFGWGLGVLLVGPEADARLRAIITSPDETWGRIHALFQALGEGVESRHAAEFLEQRTVSQREQMEHIHRVLDDTQAALYKTEKLLVEAHAAQAVPEPAPVVTPGPWITRLWRCVRQGR